MILSTNRSTRTLILTTLICCLFWASHQQESTTISSINLNQLASANQSSNSYQYFQVTFNVTHRIFLLTIDEDRRSYLGVYLYVHPTASTQPYNRYPNETNNTKHCDQSNFDTCIVQFTEVNYTEEVTIYFSIYSYSQISYGLFASLDDVLKLNITQARRYRLENNQYQTLIISISGDQMEEMEELVMHVYYNDSGVAGKFRIIAGIDQLPIGSNYYSASLTGVTVGAFNKILKLPKISANSTYFILMDSELGTIFNIDFKQSSPSAPRIDVNSSVVYYTYKNLSYASYTSFEHMQLPLYIYLYAYSGYGVFKLNYCNGLIRTTFQNINGENGEIIITAGERGDCQESMKSSSFGLLIQNIEIAIDNVQTEFGYKIILFEDIYTVQISFNLKTYGVFMNSEQSRAYQIELYDSTEEVKLSYGQITDKSEGSLLFQVEECQKKKNRDKCKMVASSLGETSGFLAFVPKSNLTYNAKVSNFNSTKQRGKLQFQMLLTRAVVSVIALSPSQIYLQEIEENEYLYYSINLTKISEEQKVKIKNLSQIAIKITEVNGEVVLMTSLSIPKPTYEAFSGGKSDIVFAWSGRSSYLVNQTTEMIYLSVQGYEQALYYIQYTLDVDADIPAKYTKIVDGTQNYFELSQNHSYELLTFSSHIIPYKISLTGRPKCIKYGYTLPLNQTCVTDLPKEFSSKVVYFNISNGEEADNFKFSVYVNSGDYVLNDKNPLLFGCLDICYEEVTVQLEQDSKVIHQGRGLIWEYGNESNRASNSFIKLTCTQYPCSVRINASLTNGGEMNLFLESSGIQEIHWSTAPITFGNYPKKCIFTIRTWSEINSILIYSEALQLDVYYNIVDIHEKKTNIISYDFPTYDKYEVNSTGNPLRNVHIIQIDSKLLDSKDCRNRNSLCIVALSLYPNLSVEYNMNYFKGGIGFVSSNTYQYLMPLNIAYQIEERFSMTYFTHQLKNLSQAYLNYRINIEPLSNCHPKLFVGDHVWDPTFSTPTYDDAVVTFRQDWINFTVLSETSCIFRVALTDTAFQTVSQNRYYNLQTSQNSITVVYRSEYSNTNGFNIQVQTGSLFQHIDYILVNKISEGGIMIAPIIGNNTAMAVNSSSLFVEQAQSYNTYIICIVTKSKLINLLIRKDAPILLRHNQEHRQVISAGNVFSYQIYSTGSVALFLTTNSQYPRVTINKDYNNTKVVSTYITNTSKPWIYVNAISSKLEQYSLTINNNNGESDISISILYEENDIYAYKRLYEGIITYDAFVSHNEMNCYYYETPLVVGQKDILVDFVMRGANTSFALYYRAFIKDATIRSSIVHLFATTHRLTLEFVPNQNYTICFHSPNVSVLNTEYYVLVNDPNMEHLIEDYTLTQNNEKSYDMYEIVEEGFNENVMIELTTCSPTANNEKVLVGSSSFTDSEMGRFTDLVDYQKNRDSIFAKLSVNEGYFYFGVKNVIYLNELLNTYTIRFQNMGSHERLLANTWQLKTSKIVKIYRDEKDKSKMKIEVPEIVNINRAVQQVNITINYVISILDLTNYSEASKIPLDILSRCPDYHESKVNRNRAKQEVKAILPFTTNMSFIYSDMVDYQKTRYSPIFTINSSDLPAKFNITGRIEVKANSQKFSYYYDTTFHLIDPREEQEEEGMTSLLVIVLVICAVLLIVLAVYFCYASKQKKEVEAKQDFQMKHIDQDGNNSTPGRDLREELTAPKVSKKENYGQFVDEIN